MVIQDLSWNVFSACIDSVSSIFHSPSHSFDSNGNVQCAHLGYDVNQPTLEMDVTIKGSIQNAGFPSQNPLNSPFFYRLRKVRKKERCLNSTFILTEWVPGRVRSDGKEKEEMGQLDHKDLMKFNWDFLALSSLKVDY